MPEKKEGPTIHIPIMKTFKVGHDKTHVIWEIQGEKVQRLPWQVARLFARAIMAQAGRVEELMKADQIVNDQAFLFGHGFPLGLTQDPAMQNEARKQAANDPKLRKQGLGMRGIESTEKVGTPRLIQGPPPKQEVGKDG